MTIATRSGHANPSMPMWWLALAYLLFVVYGSLVPLQLRDLAFADAWTRYWSLAEQHALRTSSVDWAVNIVLYVPLGFFWLGVFWHRWRLGARLAASGLVLLLGMLVSGGIEFTQLFVPARTSSFNDIVANTLGSALGVLAWWLFGRNISDWLGSLHGGIGRAHLLQKWVLAYLLLLCGYNLMPLDLSVSPVEIYHKWRAGMVRIVPFTQMPTDVLLLLYASLSEIVLWAIPAWLAQRSGRYPARQIVVGLTLAAAMIETLQLFVMSRVTDSSSIVFAALGAALGLWLAQLADRWLSGPEARLRLSCLAWLWALAVLAAQWYPYQFHADWHAAMLEIDQALGNAPLTAYYRNSELGALTSMLRKLLLFVPLGIVLRLLFAGQRTNIWRVALPVSMLALLVELGQALQPGRVGDIADLLLQCMGAAAGWWLCGVLQAAEPEPSSSKPIPPARRAVSRASQSQGLTGGIWPWLMIAATSLTLVSIGAVLPRLSGLPYNVRELIVADAPLRSSFLLCLAAYWIAVVPLLASALLLRRRGWLSSMLLWPLLHGTGAFFLLWFAVPQEALDDVLGSPVLGWPWQWERLARFIGLFAVWSVWLTGALLLAGRKRLLLDRRASAFWCITALLWLPLAYWAVVLEAATDNLVELMAGSGALWAAAILALALAVFLIAVALAGRWLVGRPSRRGGSVFALLLALPPVYLLVWLGSEAHLVKYQQVFSALQFLLSSDRRHYLDPSLLWMRFALAYCVVALGLLLLQLPFWKLCCLHADRLARAARAQREALRQGRIDHPGAA